DLGLSLSLGHPVGSYSRLIGTFSMDTRTYDEKAYDPDLGRFANSSYRSFELALATDTTDHPFFPTTGYRNRLSVTFGGGLLGGDGATRSTKRPSAATSRWGAPTRPWP